MVARMVDRMYLTANYGGQDGGQNGGQNVLTRQLWWPGCTYPPTMVARMVAMTRTRAATIPLEAIREIWTQLQLRVKSNI